NLAPMCTAVKSLVLVSLITESLVGCKNACDKDPQCGVGMCCAISIWIQSLRMCTPLGNVGDSCHPLARKVGRSERRLTQRSSGDIMRVPFWGKRMHHTCPCLPGLACARTPYYQFRCLPKK
uniref:Prokineticin 2 n=1 Tax=Ornithorhynchus anatinus TaxID=9258 RepID=A0A6I8NDG7_ORNAN